MLRLTAGILPAAGAAAFAAARLVSLRLLIRTLAGPRFLIGRFLIATMLVRAAGVRLILPIRAGSFFARLAHLGILTVARLLLLARLLILSLLLLTGLLLLTRLLVLPLLLILAPLLLL